jgi:hypothetical protein
MPTTEEELEFSPEISDAVHGLAWLGHLEEVINFCGHTFILRTLKADEELEASLIAKEYMETLGQAKAWAWAHVALALESVDGEPDFCPAIGPDKKSWSRAKFNFITQNWYWPVGNYLFERYAELNRRSADAIQAVEDLSTRSLTPFGRSPDSSIEQERSPEIPPIDFKFSSEPTETEENSS